jgi:GntR family transcriptional repressor for pyruvate dehydrogenase complex
MEKQHATSEYEKAIQYIYSLMQDGILQNGSKLPTERTIAETLGIGRNSTREALSILHGMGMIERVQGSGNYIKKCRRVDPSDAYDDAGTWQYHEIRGL